MGQIVGRKTEGYPIPDQNSDMKSSRLSGKLGGEQTAIAKLYGETAAVQLSATIN